MTYSTGSGDYTALMAAVLAHAVTDGWTTSGGLWPISKGNVRGVDWTTYTDTEADYIAHGGATFATRYIRLSVGTSPANATTNAASSATSALIPNMNYTITSWHIYSDPSLCDYINVAFNFSNGVNGDCWGHFGFGELDKHGMTHTATVYATASPKRGYAVNTNNSNGSYDWNGGFYQRYSNGYTGFALGEYSLVPIGNSVVFIVDPTVSSIPLSGWPAVDVIQDHSHVLDVTCPNNSAMTYNSPALRTGNYNFRWSTWAQYTSPQPYSGAITMSPLPFVLLQNLVANSGLGIYLGSFPNVRLCGMETYSPKDQVTFAAEDWDLYPVLRKTPWSSIMQSAVASSGEAGYAHKRVV